MIPYAELERALARWKARAHSGANEVGGHDIVHSSDVDHEADSHIVSDISSRHGTQPAVQHNGTTGEIDANELVESYED